MPVRDKICNLCGATGLWWSRTADEKFLLYDSSGIHTCGPVTKASAVRTTTPGLGSRSNTPSMSVDVEAMARNAVLDMVAKVTESFQRTINDKAYTAEQTLNSLVTEYNSKLWDVMNTCRTQAMDEFRNLMPQRHDLYVTSPDHTTVMPDVKPHYQLQRMVDWLNIREHVWAAGPAGSGKTTAAEQAAQVLSLPAYVLPCGQSTNDWSLQGWLNPTTGTYIPGHMRQPFEHGGVFVLDEIDNTNPSVLTTINGALSGSSYQFPDVLVKRHPDFVVVGCANTWGHGPDRQYVGRNQLDAATLDRFKRVPWTYDEDAEYDWAGRDQSPWVSYVQQVRQYVNELSMRVVVSPRASIGGASGLRNGISWEVVAEDCLWNGMGDDDRTRLQSLVEVR